MSASVLRQCRWTFLGILAGCLLGGAGPVRAQDAAEALPPAGPEAAGVAEAAAEPAPDCAAPEAPKSPWEKVPPVRVFPRLGDFQVLPSGPGYYSLHDVLTGTWREGPPKFPYPPFGVMPYSFFDADFRYLDSPANEQHDLLDCLHRIELGDDWLFNTGGEFRWRYMNESDSRLTTTNNTYDLFRTRVYGDLWYRDIFRVYVEYLDAESSAQDLPPLPIDRDRSDLLNAFIDVKVCEIEGSPAYLRVGRQELLFGSERLISPLDWANTRRTFEGVRGFYTSDKFDLDAFWVQPVIPDPSRFDSVDDKQNFAGVWATYRPEKGQALDLYYLMLDNANHTSVLGLMPAPFTVHTLGGRSSGDWNDWLWDVEPMLQLGEHGSQNILAGAASVGGGYHFEEQPLNPTLWFYFDWASGTDHPGTGSYNTFNQLFPFGHYYLGWLDLVGRQNIQDANAHLFLYPTKWITVWMQYHHFMLDSSRDALYNAAGVAIRRDPTGQAGTNVGDEFDLVLNFHLGPHSDLLTGYSKLFAGTFIDKSGPAVSPGLTYVQYEFRW
jgi:hypothetical protein